MPDELNVRIRTEDAIRFFETKAALAKALNIQPQAITPWGEFVPPLRAFQLREMYPSAFSGSGDLTAQVA